MPRRALSDFKGRVRRRFDREGALPSIEGHPADESAVRRAARDTAEVCLGFRFLAADTVVTAAVGSVAWFLAPVAFLSMVVGVLLVLLLLTPYRQRDEARRVSLRHEQAPEHSEADRALLAKLCTVIANGTCLLEKMPEDRSLKEFIEDYSNAGLQTDFFWLADGLLQRGFIGQRTRNDLVRINNPAFLEVMLRRLSYLADQTGAWAVMDNQGSSASSTSIGVP